MQKNYVLIPATITSTLLTYVLDNIWEYNVVCTFFHWLFWHRNKNGDNTKQTDEENNKSTTYHTEACMLLVLFITAHKYLTYSFPNYYSLQFLV
jgi:hypothetical protein